jgi:ribonucleotide monophosphatase NagD (HAD superfamily)
MVGDRVDADLGAAHAAGIDGAIVLTGASDRATAEAAAEPSPVAIAERLETLVLG